MAFSLSHYSLKNSNHCQAAVVWHEVTHKLGKAQCKVASSPEQVDITPEVCSRLFDFCCIWIVLS